jgi:16S rRNA (adenine1518-N6/adenine1519-N6)-dimethyltransferase
MKLLDLKARMHEMEVLAKKSLGQNFLVNEAVIRKIIDRVSEASAPFLVEVGPGLGSLTEHLVDKKPLLIELDRVFVKFWRDRGFEVVEGDALKINWDSLSIPVGSWLVSNLPYQISTHIVVDRSLGPKNIVGMVLMFQKEVAERLMAKPRTAAYGFLSVIAQNFWEMKRVADAGPGDFHPPPKIASRVLSFTRKSNVALDSGFVGFTKAAFAQRRKFLLKNLRAVGHKDWESVFTGMSINLKARAEELTPEQFAELYRRWKSE